MKNQLAEWNKKLAPRTWAWISSFLIVVVLAIAGSAYLSQQLKTAKAELALSVQKVSELEASLTLAADEKTTLSEALYSEQQKVIAFEEQISGLNKTVNTLEKLSKTDPELLQKYSKVFFLNEHYEPDKLTEIDEAFVLDGKKTYEIQTAVWPYLEEMLEEAKEDGIELMVASAYRSFGTQATLKNGYLVTYGSGANQFSADQGYSEHQLGTTIDLTTPQLGTLSISFENTEAYNWLTKYAYRYGFVLSYPKGNAYYQFEPWHWRFVGQALARRLHREKKNFYDLDQRTIDSYLVRIFD